MIFFRSGYYYVVRNLFDPCLGRWVWKPVTLMGILQVHMTIVQIRIFGIPNDVTMQQCEPMIIFDLP